MSILGGFIWQGPVHFRLQRRVKNGSYSLRDVGLVLPGMGWRFLPDREREQAKVLHSNLSHSRNRLDLLRLPSRGHRERMGSILSETIRVQCENPPDGNA